MNILITGATGFIGQPLVRALLSEGHKLALWVRDSERAKHIFGGNSLKLEHITIVEDLALLELPIDAIINLAGEAILDERWSKQRKSVLEESRIGVTRKLIQWVTQQDTKPTVLISGSAVGIYGNSPQDIELDEQAKFQDCYPSRLCQQWEFEARKAQSFGLRVCMLRIGVVLHPSGGALKKMWPPFSQGLGGRVGSGKQWLSWIHLNDAVRIIIFLLNKDISGPVNVTSPKPVTYQQFTRALAKTLNRPHLLPMPKFVLKLLFGEAAQLLVEGQKAVPKKVLENNFLFQFDSIEEALQSFPKSGV